MLEVKNIVKNYRYHRALNKVSLDVPKQKIFGLLGPNGAGKTTLIRIINQIISKDSGEIRINGESLAPHHIEIIGYLPEERGLYKKMKVQEQALYLAQLKGLSHSNAKRKLDYWFEKFDLNSWRNKKVEDLSKGMAQKIQFITTILHEPKLLVLDEPFSGFDPINAKLIKEEILELRKNGATIILSTHNMPSVEQICDQIALINKSEVILEGSMKELKEKFKSNTYEIRFKGELMGFTNALWTDYKLINRKQEDGLLVVTIQILGNHTLNDLLKTVMPFAQIYGVQEVVPSMDDIFIKVVKDQEEVPVG